MTLSDKQLAATKVATILGRQFGRRIVFEGDKMAASKDTTWLPAWDLTIPEVYDLAIGVTVHEAGHPRFDDFDALKDWLMSKATVRRGLYQSAENIVADVRLEYHMMDLYPGARMALDRIVRHVLADTPFGDYSDGNAVRIFLDYALFEFRYKSLGQGFLKPKRDHIAAIAAKVLGARVLRRVEELRRTITTIGPDLSCFPAVLALADDLVEIIDQAKDDSENEEEQPDQPNSGSGDAGGDADDSTDDNASDDDGSQNPASSSATGDQDGNDQTDPSVSPGSSGEDDESSDADGGAPGSSDPGHPNRGSQPSSDGDSSDGTAGSDDSASGSGTPQQGQDDDSQPPVRQSPQAGLDWSVDGIDPIHYDPSGSLCESLPVADQPFKAEFTPAASAGCGGSAFTRNLDTEFTRGMALTRPVRMSLHDLVQSTEDQEAYHSRRGRSITPGRITRMFGDGRMFSRKVEEETEALNIAILVDVSTSTANINGELAVATLAISKALDSMDEVDRSVYAFPSPASPLAEILAPHEKEAKLRTGWPMSSGGTPLFPAVIQLVPLMLMSNRPRQVILCVTDGQPDACSKHEALSLLKRYGIEFYGVVIGSPGYDRSIFQASRSIDRVSDLPRALEMLVQEIMGLRPAA